MVIIAYQFFNPNPLGKLTGDCSVRAISAALNLTWDEAYALITANGFVMADMPNANSVWGRALQVRGFKREAIQNSCPDCYTAGDFCRDNKTGIYVLGFGTHVCTVKDGVIYDSWDSSREVPQYFWRG